MKNFFKKIIIGTWSISGDLGKIRRKQRYQLIEKCIQNGFLEFDIAPTYGKGKIDTFFSNLKNFKLKINTKLGYNKNFHKDFTISNLKKSLDSSLKLHEKINIIFLHNPRNEIKNWDKIIYFLKDIKKQKLVKNIGISLARDFYPPVSILNEFDYVQDEINLLRNSILLSKINKFKIIARSPLATGILADNFSKKKTPNRSIQIENQGLHEVFFNCSTQYIYSRCLKFELFRQLGLRTSTHTVDVRNPYVQFGKLNKI